VTTAKLMAWHEDEDAEDSNGDAPLQPAIGTGLCEFLLAVSELLHETTRRFEETVAQVLELVMTGRGLEERNLVVTLQDFDLLQQEFVALADVLARYGTASKERRLVLGEDPDIRQIIGTITIADLRERLLLRLGYSPANRESALQPGEELF
jgi:hypothetical protein